MPVEVVRSEDLEELLPLMRGYCDFYEVAPPDEALLALSESLLANPAHEGAQLIARDDSGRAVGFATIFWTWSTTRAARIAIMNDLFVDRAGRGGGHAQALIQACADKAREHGAVALEWQTAADNYRAQAVYDRIGGRRDDRWVDYWLPTAEQP